MLPNLLVVLLGRLGVTESVILVVGVNQVVNDGTRLPERNSRVGILNGWRSCSSSFSIHPDLINVKQMDLLPLGLRLINGSCLRTEKSMYSTS